MVLMDKFRFSRGKRSTYLAISVLDSGNIGFTEGALDESEDQRRFTDATGAKDDDSIVVALFRHPFNQLCDWFQLILADLYRHATM